MAGVFVVPRHPRLQRVHPVALRSAPRHFIGGVTKMHPRLAVDPLRPQGCALPASPEAPNLVARQYPEENCHVMD